MTDDESRAANQVSQQVLRVADMLRRYADQIEAEGGRGINNARQRKHEWSSYGWAAGAVLQELAALQGNLDLGNLVQAATDADAARIKKDMEAGE
jgi:hypothetical protein